ncbi:hypothetical protein DFH07DRAFT_438451 [Mycena maculata]|uniref:Uncharacterized protein n=1 Tax=Mycena maculata TaxID=230809 RepID=A0AAD7K8N7_9AGAR|nr:hypothetical protein DFH07DRAFT_438451 [Mycena maculata]
MEWAHARLALDKCLQGIEGEGEEIPTEWWLWRVELELARTGNIEGANCGQVRCVPSCFIFKYYVLIPRSDTPCLNPSPDVLTSRGLVLFLSVRLPQALQHVQSALCVNLGHEPTQRLCKRIKDTERVKEEGNLTGFTATFHPEM